MDKNIRYIVDYYLLDKLCTRITLYVDLHVDIINFTDKLIYKAFGVKEDITYQDLLEFFEERCFPRTRINCKEILEAGGFEYYDPEEIVMRTKGRLCTDSFWLDFKINDNAEKLTKQDVLNVLRKQSKNNNDDKDILSTIKRNFNIS